MNQSVNTVVVDALKTWLRDSRAQHLAQFAASSAADYSEVVERTHAMAHHPCIARIREELQYIVGLLQFGKKEQVKAQMREIDEALAQCRVQEHELQGLIDMTEHLRKIANDLQNDLLCHQEALVAALSEWRLTVNDKNPLNDDVVRNDTAERRLQSITALIQSCQTSEMQLSLMYHQMNRLFENLTTLRQVTYPVWQQKAINRTMVDDQAFLNSLQQTLKNTGEIQP